MLTVAALYNSKIVCAYSLVDRAAASARICIATALNSAWYRYVPVSSSNQCSRTNVTPARSPRIIITATPQRTGWHSGCGVSSFNIYPAPAISFAVALPLPGIGRD